MTTNPSGDRPRGRDDIVFRQLDDEWVLFDPKADRLHALNLTAALVWSHCMGELDAGAIADAVGGSFDPPVASVDILADVEATLQRFREEGLLA
jgi:hypothetical protein